MFVVFNVAQTEVQLSLKSTNSAKVFVSSVVDLDVCNKLMIWMTLMLSAVILPQAFRYHI